MVRSSIPASILLTFVSYSRCYNCGEFANHIAAKCSMGPQPKRCHNCRSEDHLIADCPTRVERERKRTGGGEQQNGENNGDTASAATEAMAKLQIEQK